MFRSFSGDARLLGGACHPGCMSVPSSRRPEIESRAAVAESERVPPSLLRADAANDSPPSSAAAAPRSLRRLPSVLTVEELADLLRVNRKTLYDALARGDIPGA